MNRRIPLGLIAVVCLAPAAVAWSGWTNELTLQPQSRLWVQGTSTVRGYECEATTFSAHIDAAGADPASAVLNGEKAVETVELTVPARALDCANRTMNEHMLKALKAAEHPEIVFRMSCYSLARDGLAMRAELTGTLRLGGEERPLRLSAEVAEAGAGVLRVVGSHEVRMSEFGLRAPTLMMGTMRVHDRVTVNFDLYLRA